MCIHTGAEPDYQIREIFPDAIVWTRVEKKKKKPKNKKKKELIGPEFNHTKREVVKNDDAADDEEAQEPVVRNENGFADDDDEQDLLDEIMSGKGPGQFMAFLLVVKDDTFSNELEAMTTRK